jgi:CRISPR-associated protein Csb2
LRQLSSTHVAAFEFLQTLDAPAIIAPIGHIGTPFRIAVPNNDLDTVARAWSRKEEPRKGSAELKTMKTVRSVHLCGGNAVHYLFPINASDPEFENHRNTLTDAARSIIHLGWGVDMVAGIGSVLSEADAASLPGERWKPVEGASANGLRVPINGTLNDLMAKHAAFLGRLLDGGFKPAPPLSVFRVIGYRRATDPPQHRLAAFRLRHPVEDRAAVFALTRANHVAAMTRCATARLASEQGQPGEWIDRYVHGHRRKDDESLPRFSYLPLPSIERRGQKNTVLGAIRRVLVAELADTRETHLHWARQMLPGQFLTDDKTGDRKAMLTPLTGGDWVLRQYTDAADSWATVTPVVLPGSDEGKFTKAEKLLVKAVHHAGYSSEAIADLEFRTVSFFPGCDLALRFQRPDYLKKDHWSVYHVRICWKQPVKGPLALGAGRHCGLGIFATMKLAAA